MLPVGAYRPHTVSLDKGLVMAAWWTVTRSMVLHCVALGTSLIVTGLLERDTQALSYRYILHWASLWVWGIIIAVLGLIWLFSRGIVCGLSGILIGFWFFTFATAFFVAWITLDIKGTTTTAWITYAFLGWAWFLVTYVVWRDERHSRAEISAIQAIRDEVKELQNGGLNDPRPD